MVRVTLLVRSCALTVITTVCEIFSPGFGLHSISLLACLFDFRRTPVPSRSHFLYFGNEDAVLTAYTEKRNRYKLGLDRWLGC